VSWSGDVSGTSLAVSITMSTNKSVTATFTELAPPVSTFTLTVASDPINGGSVTRMPNQSSFDPGDQVTLDSIANPGYAFAFWSGDASGSQKPILITMDRSKYVLGHFVPVLGETISAPSAPEGPTTGTTGTSFSFSTHGASSSEGHPIQYVFDWGDGTDSGWLPVGTSNASHAWNEPKTFLVKARARCATDVSIVSNWSQSVAVVIEQAVLPLIGVLENPVDGQKATGLTTIDGWALDGKGIKKVELYIDDQFVGNIAYGTTLTDVKEAHPEYPNAENSGFCMVWNASSLSAGPHRIKVKLHNLDGQTKDFEIEVNVIKFHGEVVENIAPASRVFRGNKVTSNGVIKKYDIKMEWSKDWQGFVITEIVPKK
ncbi:MAG: Ig-like domain-containing protein, partial [Pseudomonadota bacterium]